MLLFWKGLDLWSLLTHSLPKMLKPKCTRLMPSVTGRSTYSQLGKDGMEAVVEEEATGEEEVEVTEVAGEDIVVEVEEDTEAAEAADMVEEMTIAVMEVVAAGAITETEVDMTTMTSEAAIFVV